MRTELLEQIRREPDDDELRLVYADALEQSGDTAQAEFVRAGVAIARGTASPAERERAAELERDHGTRFAGAIAEHAERWTFERGLVSSVAIGPLTLARHADAVLGTSPITELLVLDPDNDDMDLDPIEAAAMLASCPHLSVLRTLDMRSGGLGDDWDDGNAMTALVASPHLTRLATIIVGSECSTATACAIAAAHARLPVLRELRFWAPLDAGRVGDDGAVAIGESPLCARLEVLEIIGAGVDEDGARAIASGTRLRELSLPGTWYVQNKIGEAGAAALADAPLQQLEILELCGASIRDQGLERIAAAPWLARVRYLGLADNELTDRGALALARSPYATRLETIALDSGLVHPDCPNRISDDALHALEALASGPGVRR